MMKNEIKRLSDFYRFSEDIIEKLTAVYGDKVEVCLQALKTPCERYSVRVNTLKIDPASLVSRLLKRGIEAESHAEVPEAIFLRVEGPFEMPETEKKIVADRFSSESILQGSHLYAPGVVKCEGIKRGNRVTIVSDYGQAVGVGIARMSETEILTYRHGLAVEVTDPIFSVPSLRETEEFKLGYIYPQSFPSIVTSRVLDPKPGEVIVDMCAAPGGKTGHIAQLMQNKGQIFAVDRNQEKIKKIRETMVRLGVENVKLICHDSRYLDVDLPHLEADRVVIDPPCSALGVRPKLYDYKKDAEIQALANYQRQFLKAASRIVKPGGVIVYSTCTLTLEENESVVEFGVEECGLDVEKQDYFFGSPGVAKTFPKAKRTQRFYPEIHDTPGYFIAGMRVP